MCIRDREFCPILINKPSSRTFTQSLSIYICSMYFFLDKLARSEFLGHKRRGSNIRIPSELNKCRVLEMFMTTAYVCRVFYNINFRELCRAHVHWFRNLIFVILTKIFNFFWRNQNPCMRLPIQIITVFKYSSSVSNNSTDKIIFWVENRTPMWHYGCPDESCNKNYASFHESD